MDDIDEDDYERYYKLPYRSCFEEHQYESNFRYNSYDPDARQYVTRRNITSDNSPSSLIDGLTNIRFNSGNDSRNHDTSMDLDIDRSGDVEKTNAHKNDLKPVETLNCNITKTKCFYIVITILLFILIALYYQSYQCFSEYHLNTIRTELNQVLYQSSAVSIIVRNLDEIRKGIKVLPFIGTTGVGKTFTADLLKRSFPCCVYALDTNTLRSSDINICKSCTNLVIIDDLNVDDCRKVVDFIAQISPDFQVLVIPIFNTHSTEDGWVYETRNVDAIHEQFDKSGFDYEVVPFYVLKAEMLKDWLERELFKLGIIDKYKRFEIISLIDLDEVERTGLKSMNAKLKLALEGVS